MQDPHDDRRRWRLSGDLDGGAVMDRLMAAEDEEPILLWFGDRVFRFRRTTSGPGEFIDLNLAEIAQLGPLNDDDRKTYGLHTPETHLHFRRTLVRMTRCGAEELPREVVEEVPRIFLEQLLDDARRATLGSD